MPSADLDARGQLSISKKPGDERFEVKVMKLDFSDTDYHVWVETGEDTGEYEDAGEIDQKGNSHVGFLRLRTKDGDALPQGVESVTDLSLRRVEVRDDDGTCYLETKIPEFGQTQPDPDPDPDPDPAPSIDLDPASFAFSAVEGGVNPASQVLTITNDGDATLSWTASDDAAWLSLSAGSDTAEPGESDVVSLLVDIAGLAAGNYNATVTVDDPAATNGPQSVSVDLTVDTDGDPGPTEELVIDFEDKLADGTVGPDSDVAVGDLVSGGFLFDFDNDDGNLANGELGDFQGDELTYNGTTWLFVHGFFSGGWQFPLTTVSPEAGGTFALKSLQLSEACFCANAEVVRITANFAGGGSEFQDVVLDLFLDGNTPPDEPDDDFQTAVFPDTWVELESFTIQTIQGFAQGEWVVDNIVVEVPTAP